MKISPSRASWRAGGRSSRAGFSSIRTDSEEPVGREFLQEGAEGGSDRPAKGRRLGSGPRSPAGNEERAIVGERYPPGEVLEIPPHRGRECFCGLSKILAADRFEPREAVVLVLGVPRLWDSVRRAPASRPVPARSLAPSTPQKERAPMACRWLPASRRHPNPGAPSQGNVPRWRNAPSHLPDARRREWRWHTFPGASARRDVERFSRISPPGVDPTPRGRQRALRVTP